jgi:hypothetical protein
LCTNSITMLVLLITLRQKQQAQLNQYQTCSYLVNLPSLPVPSPILTSPHGSHQ